jgi:uncharacterized protein YjbI with pentapeptide repeats
VVEGFTCGASEKYHSVCENLCEYQESGYCVLHYPFEDKKKEDLKEVLESKLAQKDYDFRGTVFSEGTSDFEEREFDADTNFGGATFIGEANFARAQFGGERTDFTGARFSGKRTLFTRAQFDGEERTYFSEAQFGGERTDFTGARFSGGWTAFMGTQFSSKKSTDFTDAQFSGGVGFRRARFSSEETIFTDAQFGGTWTDFTDAQFSSAYTSFVSVAFKTNTVRFSSATFRAKAEFWGIADNFVFRPRAWVWFNSHIEKPELLKFNHVRLHPGWFINADDVRKVNFTDVQWYGMPDGLKGTLDKEIGLLNRQRIESPHTLLAQACRKLSANAEENLEYPLANEFLYWSMDVLRKGRWHYLSWLKSFIRKNWRRVRTRFGLAATLRWIWRIVRREPLSTTRFGLVPTLYWALSGYGVKAGRAFLMLVAICAAFAALYMVFGPPKLQDLGQAVVYSLGAVARLNPEPRPTEPGLFQFLVIVEGILGPLQIALLALAIRRKVMR